MLMKFLNSSGKMYRPSSQKTAERKSMLEVAGIIFGHHDCAETVPQKIRNFQFPLMTDGGMQLLREAVLSHGSCK